MAAPVLADTEPLDVTVRNTGTTALSCDAAFAHWYSDTFGEVAPGASLTIALRADPATGTVYARNAKGDEMPVQRLWCGHRDESWATRAEIQFERRAGQHPAPMTLDCAATARATGCTPH